MNNHNSKMIDRRQALKTTVVAAAVDNVCCCFLLDAVDFELLLPAAATLIDEATDVEDEVFSTGTGGLTAELSSRTNSSLAGIGYR